MPINNGNCDGTSFLRKNQRQTLKLYREEKRHTELISDSPLKMSSTAVTSSTQLVIPPPPARILEVEDKSRLVSPFGPGHEDLTTGTVEGRTAIFYYYDPDPEDRKMMANQMLRSLIKGTGDQTEAAIISKLLTAFICVFPNEKEGLNHKMSSIRPGTISLEYRQYLKDFVKPTMPDPEAGTNGKEENAVIEYIPDDLLGISPVEEEYTEKELYVVLAIGIYAVVKEATEDNATAFTERRKNAAMRQLKIPETSELASSENWWKIGPLMQIHGAFNVYVSARIALITEVCRWSTAPVTDYRAWVWGQVRLLRGHGMVPMEAMSSFVNACTHIVQGHTVLYEEALIFLQAKGEFDKMAPFDRNFSKTIKGNLYTPLPLNRLQNLLGASVAYGRIASKTFGNYRGGKMDPVVKNYVESALALMM